MKQNIRDHIKGYLVEQFQAVVKQEIVDNKNAYHELNLKIKKIDKFVEDLKKEQYKHILDHTNFEIIVDKRINQKFDNLQFEIHEYFEALRKFNDQLQKEKNLFQESYKRFVEKDSLEQDKVIIHRKLDQLDVKSYQYKRELEKEFYESKKENKSDLLKFKNEFENKLDEFSDNYQAFVDKLDQYTKENDGYKNTIKNFSRRLFIMEKEIEYLVTRIQRILKDKED